MSDVSSSVKVFTLAFPFEYRGKQYTEFRARRPKVRDLRKFVKDIEKDSVLAMELALTNLFEVDNAVIAEIDIEDFAPMKAWFEGFLKPIVDASTES